MLVRAIRKCYVDNGLRPEGVEFDYNGPKNTNLEILDGSTWPEDDKKGKKGKDADKAFDL